MSIHRYRYLTAPYPRVRGEPPEAVGAAGYRAALSPRARGTPPRGAFRHRVRSPIPACAGNPRLARNANNRLGPYPRVRGEPPTL